MPNFNIDRKILLLVGTIFIVFIVGLAGIITTTSANNLAQVKQAELDRTSRILANRISDMEQNARLAVRNFEENEQIVEELRLLTNLGPYYADPGSYFETNYLETEVAIDPADQVYVFQAQLNLVQSLQSVQQINNLTAISFFLIPPFDLAPEKKPVLSLRMDQDAISLVRFPHKGAISSSIYYEVDPDIFTPPPADYFDISSAFATPPEQFYAESAFTVATPSLTDATFPQSWTKTATTRSAVVVIDGVPILQTWAPIAVPVPHPETWQDTVEPVGLALVEQELGVAALDALQQQLGLDVGLARGGQLLISSPTGPMPNNSGANLPLDNEFQLAGNNFFYAAHPIAAGTTSLNLDAVVLSPVSELTTLTTDLQRQIALVSGLAMILAGVLLFFTIRAVVTRPLGDLITGVELITAGNLDQQINVQSRDELGTLAQAFNSMTTELRQTLENLEERVETRTRAIEASAQVSRRLSQIMAQDQLVSEVVHEIQNAFGYYHVHIYLVDGATGDLVMLGGTGDAGMAMLAGGHRVAAGQGLVGRSAGQNEVVLVSDVSREAGWLPNPLLPDTKSEVAIPIAIGNQVLGVLDVQESKVDGLDEEDTRLLQSVASQIAVGLRNARLYEEAQQRAHQEAIVNQIGQQIRSATDIESVLQIAARELGTALQATRAQVQIGQDTNGHEEGNM